MYILVIVHSRCTRTSLHYYKCHSVSQALNRTSIHVLSHTSHIVSIPLFCTDLEALTIFIPHLGVHVFAAGARNLGTIIASEVVITTIVNSADPIFIIDSVPPTAVKEAALAGLCA